MKRLSDALMRAIVGFEATRAEVLELWQVRRRRFLIFWTRERYDLVAELALVDVVGGALRYQGCVTTAGSVSHYRILDQDNTTLIVGTAADTFPTGLLGGLTPGLVLNVTFNLGLHG